MGNNISKALSPELVEIIAEAKKDLNEEDIILSDEQIEEIAKNIFTGEDYQAESPYNFTDEERAKMLEESKIEYQNGIEIVAVQNPSTGGIATSVPVQTNNNKVVDVFDMVHDCDEQLKEIDDMNKAVNTLGSLLNIQPSECISLVKIIQEYDSLDDNLFIKLPKSIQRSLEDNTPIGNRGPKIMNRTAHDFISFVKKEADLEKTIIDLQEAILHTVGKESSDDIMVDYMESIRKTMEIDLLEQADKLAENGELYKAKHLRLVSKTFTSSYHFDTLLKRIENRRLTRVKGKKIRLAQELYNDIDKLKTKCYQFNNKYRTSKYSIRDITSITPILHRHLPEYEYEDIAMFTIHMINTFNILKPSKILDHTLMYYTIMNIVSLDMGKTNSFSELLLANIRTVIEAIHDSKL